MEKFVDLNEELDFLDCEIIDDDDDAPVGDLVVHEKAQEPVAEVAEEVAVVAPVEVIEEVPAETAVEAPVEEVAEPTNEVEEPVKEEVAEETVQPEVVAEVAAEVEPVKEEIEETPVQESAEIKAELAETDFATPAEPAKKPAAEKKRPAPKKQVAEGDIWGVASIKTKKENIKPEEEKPVAATKDTKKAAPATKAPAKAEAPAKKEAPAKAAPAKKEVAKAAPAKKEAPAVKTAPAKKEEVKAAPAKKVAAEKSAPAAKEAPAKAAAKKPEVKETVIVEGEGKMHGKYVIKKTANGNFVFKLYSSNYRVIAIGAQPYADIKSCRGGINSVINNAEKAPIENQTLKKYEIEKCPKWEVYADKKGEFRLRLIASNGNIVATTNDGYVGIDGAKNGIAAIARASKGCAIVRNDNLW